MSEAAEPIDKLTASGWPAELCGKRWAASEMIAAQMGKR